MSYSVGELIDKLKKLHPDLYPVWYIEDQGKYLFNLLQRGVSKEESLANFYAVDPEKGTIAGPISPLTIYGNPDLSGKLDHPHMCSGEEQKPLQHDAFVSGGSLMHFGIKGQKWGVRRFQNEDGSYTAAGRERYGIKTEEVEKKLKEKGVEKKPGLFEKMRINEAKRADEWFSGMSEDLSKSVDRNESKKDKLDKGRLAVDVAVTVINPLNAINLVADGVGSARAKAKTDSYFKNREEKSELDPKTGLYVKKDGSYNDKQDLEAVNPSYMDMKGNSKNNCMLCTTTYDLRKRGYDVTAQLDSQGYNFNDLKRWYPGAKIEHSSRYDENGRALKQNEYVEKTIKNLEKQGDGARGNIMIAFKQGGAHSIFYEVQNGKVIFKDGQTGIVYDGKVSLKTSTYNDPRVLLNSTYSNAFARLDNVEPDFEQIKKECVR